MEDILKNVLVTREYRSLGLLPPVLAQSALLGITIFIQPPVMKDNHFERYFSSHLN